MIGDIHIVLFHMNGHSVWLAPWFVKTLIAVSVAWFFVILMFHLGRR